MAAKSVGFLAVEERARVVKQICVHVLVCVRLVNLNVVVWTAHDDEEEMRQDASSGTAELDEILQSCRSEAQSLTESLARGEGQGKSDQASESESSWESSDEEQRDYDGDADGGGFCRPTEAHVSLAV